MVVNLDFKKREPIYEQIISEIERYIALGILKPKEQLPSVRMLAMDLGINPNTVKKAYDILEKKKVIETISTKGTFIAEKTDFVKEEKKNQFLEEMNSILLELEKLGFKKEEILKELKKES